MNRSRERASIAPWARGALLALLILLIGGSFTLDRINPGLPPLDLRWIGLLACAVIYGLAVPRRAPSRRPIDAAVLAWVAWAVWLAVSALWSPPEARIGDGVTGLVVMLIAVLLLVDLVARHDGDQLLQVLWWFLFVTATVYLLAAFAAGPGAQGRYSAFGGGPNVFVRVMAFGLLASLALAIGGRRRLLIMAPAFLVGAILSGSRGGLLAILVVAFVLGLPLVRRLPWRLVLGGATGAVVAAVGIVFAVPALRAFVQARFIDQTFEQRYGSGRDTIFTEVLGIAADHPFVGAGLDSYYALIGRFQDYQYPHNVVLASVADGGLIALVLLLAALVGLTRSALRRRVEGPTAIALLLAGGWFVIVASLFSGSYYDTRFAWVFLLLALVVRETPHAAPALGLGTRPAVRPAVRWWAAPPTQPDSAETERLLPRT